MTNNQSDDVQRLLMKPVPRVDMLSAPFWEGANEHKLVIQRCRSCATYHHPPVVLCDRCRSTDQGFEQVSGRGVIEMFSVTHDSRQPAFEAIQPYVVAIVQLEEQEDLRLFTNVQGSSIEDVAVGLPVEVAFERIADNTYIPQFRIATLR